MKENEIKITIPIGQEIDWQESAKQEKIVFKKKNIKSRSWEEYCHTRLDSKETRFGYVIGSNCGIYSADWDNCCNCSAWRDVLPTKELAEAFLAMKQLMSLRHDWIHKWSIDKGMTDDWKPVWNGNTYYHCIMIFDNKCGVDIFSRYYHPISFPTREMAKDFMNCFKDLLEIAKPII